MVAAIALLDLAYGKPEAKIQASVTKRAVIRIQIYIKLSEWIALTGHLQGLPPKMG